MTWTQRQIDGVQEACAALEFALDNCRRAMAGTRPRSRADYERAQHGDPLAAGTGDLSDLFGGLFGRS